MLCVKLPTAPKAQKHRKGVRRGSYPVLHDTLCLSARHDEGLVADASRLDSMYRRTIRRPRTSRCQMVTNHVEGIT